ncbi:MAG: ChaB family protein [Dehalococcoidia bacterium]
MTPRRRGERDTEMPSTIARSPKHAQETWQKAHDSAVESYGDGERAHRTAYSALKHSFKKEGDRWVPKERKGPSDAQAARGPTTRHRSTDEPAAPTAGGKVALAEEHTRDELYERARHLDIHGRSRMSKEELAVAVQEHEQG